MVPLEWLLVVVAVFCPLGLAALAWGREFEATASWSSWVRVEVRAGPGGRVRRRRKR